MLVVDSGSRDVIGDGGGIAAAEPPDESREPLLAEEFAVASTLDHTVGVEQQRVPDFQGGAVVTGRRWP